MLGSAASVRPGARQIKQINDAGPKACASKSRVEDADMHRYGASSGRAVVVGSGI
jgi:hypothetical protein